MDYVRPQFKPSAASDGSNTRSHANHSVLDTYTKVSRHDQITPPHLPLKKRSAQNLRAGSGISYPARGGIPRITRETHRTVSAPKAIPQQKNVNETYSNSYGASTTGLASPRANEERHWAPRPVIGGRPGSASRTSNAPFRPRQLLRTSTSIPDYKTIRAAYTVNSPGQEARRGQGLTHRVIAQSPTDGLDSVRASLRAALTVASSATEHSGTERSSIWTDRSSLSDMTSPTTTSSVVHDDTMSVEDAIDMYSNGFAEEQPTPQVIPKQRRSSARSPLSHTNNNQLLPQDNYHSTLAPPGLLLKNPGQARASISTASVAGEAAAHLLTTDSHDLPPAQDRLKALIGPPRDRYGFKKESQYVTVKAYDLWNAGYTKYLERRRKRWDDLMKQHHLTADVPERFPPKSEKVKRYIRKGVPPEWRGAVWFFYAGGPARLAQNRGQYDDLVKLSDMGAVAHIDRDHIERDLYRTFPDNIKFKPDSAPPSSISPAGHSNTQVETPMIASLRRVLQAFAVHQPRVGYCQSLNFLAGLLLLLLDGNEEKAFHLLCILTTQHLPGTHGLSLEGANVDISVLMMCLKESMPALWAEKIDDRADTTVSLAAGDMRVSTGLPTVSLATTGWFMSCFAATLPIETTLRVWDCLFYEGSKALFRVGLALFKLCEHDIRKTGDEPMEVFQVIQTKPKGCLDANLVMETATSKGSKWASAVSGLSAHSNGSNTFGMLSQKTVEGRREDRRKMYRTERERVLLKALVMPVAKGNGEGLEERFKRVGDGRSNEKESASGLLKKLASVRGR